MSSYPFLLNFLILALGMLLAPSGLTKPLLGTVGGLTFIDPKIDRYEFNVGGRLFLDETLFLASATDKQTDFPSGGTIRLAYLDLKGKTGNDWSYVLTLSFKGEESLPREAYLSYSGFTNVDLQIGQIGIPSGLENSSDYSDLMFLEASLLGEIFFPEDDYGLGIYANKTFFDLLTFSGALYQPRQQVVDNFADKGRADCLGKAIRFTFSPIHNEQLVYHLGAWLRHQALIENVGGLPVSSVVAFQGFSGPPEAQARNTASLVSTGPIGARSYELAGIEAAWLKGPLTLQGEYLLATVHRMLSVNMPTLAAQYARFYAWYIQSGYVLTGESRRYDFNSGTFARLMPSREWGALEVAIRYSAANLTYRTIQDGVEHNISFGMNWYLNAQVRVAANYIRAVIHPAHFLSTAENEKRKLNIIAARFQVAF